MINGYILFDTLIVMAVIVSGKFKGFVACRYH